LLGPNGAGKTTLIRILMDIIRANSGSVFVFGKPHTRENLDRFGYLPEERGLYTKHKVRDVLIYFGMLKGLSRAEARRRGHDWLGRVGLPEVETWRVERLSKGMSQKVQIAATLLSEPELCVLDEPFSGLDPVNVRLVQELIDQRRRSGKTTILSTHQMNQVETLCDRVALFNRGELMVYGEVNEVRERYSLKEVRVTMSGDLPTLDEIEHAERAGNGTWVLSLREGVEPHEVLAGLVRGGARISAFERALAPMDEIFVRVVQQGEA
jgi:ABC-2 type transport system ATP-binding protein